MQSCNNRLTNVAQTCTCKRASPYMQAQTSGQSEHFLCLSDMSGVFEMHSGNQAEPPVFEHLADSLCCDDGGLARWMQHCRFMGSIRLFTSMTFPFCYIHVRSMLDPCLPDCLSRKASSFLILPPACTLSFITPLPFLRHPSV